MATARKPAAARAGSWWRHEYQDSGKPWTNSTSGPSPCSTRWRRMPLTGTVRCFTPPSMAKGPPVAVIGAGRPGGPLVDADQLAVGRRRRRSIRDVGGPGDDRDVGRGVHALAGVAVAVLLAGHLADLEHHLVNHRATCQVRLAPIPVALGADRATDGDRAVLEGLGCLRPGRLDLVGADDADREDRAAELQGEARRAGAALVQRSVAAARALGEDAEQLAAPQHGRRGVECRLRLVATGAVDGDHAHRREQVL